MMKRVTAVCLCLLMICSCAFAQESVNLGGEGCDQMKYVCTLPDGRLVFCGNRGTVGNYNDARARLLCLNPDWTVSWEYVDPAKGMARYAFGALLEDGNIGIIYYNAPFQNITALEIRKFTQEGRPVGEPIDLFQRSDDIPNMVNSQWLIQTMASENGSQKAFLDWNGDVFLSIPAQQGIWIFSAMPAEDGIVLAGSESVSGGFVKIMKMDLQGRILWETVLPLMNASSEGARIQTCIRTSDGVYRACIAENRTDLMNKWCYGLIRLNENGRVLWINRESFADRTNMMCQDLIEYDGKFVFLENPDFSDVTEKVPRVYTWFDADGNKLGETELWIPREDIRGITEDESASIFAGDMLATEDGLWSLYSVEIANDDDIRKEMDSQDVILYRVPEPD